jgi:hypothetical protein
LKERKNARSGNPESKKRLDNRNAGSETNPPGKFLLSAPEHTAPQRARAYLVTDDDVARTVAGYADGRPELDDVSRNAISPTVAAASARDIPGDAQIDAGDPATRQMPTMSQPPRNPSGSLSASPRTTAPISPNSCGQAA